MIGDNSPLGIPSEEDAGVDVQALAQEGFDGLDRNMVKKLVLAACYGADEQTLSRIAGAHGLSLDSVRQVAEGMRRRREDFARGNPA